MLSNHNDIQSFDVERLVGGMFHAGLEVPAEVYAGPKRVRVGLFNQHRLVQIPEEFGSNLSVYENENKSTYNLDGNDVVGDTIEITSTDLSEQDTVIEFENSGMTWRSKIDPVEETRAYAESVLRSFAQAMEPNQSKRDVSHDSRNANARHATDQVLFFLKQAPKEQISEFIQLLLGLGGIEYNDDNKWKNLSEAERLEHLLVSHGHGKREARAEAFRLISLQ